MTRKELYNVSNFTFSQNVVLNIIFFDKHPQVLGRKLKKSIEPNTKL